LVLHRLYHFVASRFGVSISIPACRRIDSHLLKAICGLLDGVFNRIIEIQPKKHHCGCMGPREFDEAEATIAIADGSPVAIESGQIFRRRVYLFGMVSKCPHVLHTVSFFPGNAHEGY